MLKNAVKNAIGSMKITHLLNRGAGAGTIVLTYHDIRHDEDPASWLRVSESDFENQISDLKEIGKFISWRDLFSARPNEGLRFLMTFDDGYHNNYELARPILEKYQIPTVFFVSTHHMTTGESFWFDEIVTPIQALQLPHLDLSEFGLRNFLFGDGCPAVRWDDINRMLVEIKALGNMDTPQTMQLLTFLRSEYGHQVRDLLHQYRPISIDEVRDMQTSSLFDFGSHSHRHDILTYLEAEQLRDNLIRSREALSDASGVEPQMIAYPNGDFDDRVLAASRDAGYSLGFAIQNQVARSGTDPMAIPRFLIGGFDSIATLGFLVNRALLTRILKK